MSVIELTINSRAIRGDVAPRMHLGDFLRDNQNLTGTHLGCEQECPLEAPWVVDRKLETLE